MYVRCFTKSDSWNEWLSVKEKLAIEIKQIVENNKASFAFPSLQFILKKNDCYFLFSFTNIKTLFLCCYSQCIVSWLIAFNILNTQNRFVYSILELSYRLTDPILNKIRRFLPNLGSLRYITNNFTSIDLVYRNVYEALHCTNNILNL